MTSAGSAQPRRIPTRQCVACRKLVPRPWLLRLVRQPGGEVAFDEGQRMNGRGAYVCRDVGCVQTATRRGALQRALRHAVRDEVLSHLASQAASQAKASDMTEPAPPTGDGVFQPDR
jgi:hypothetical protein